MEQEIGEDDKRKLLYQIRQELKTEIPILKQELENQFRDTMNQERKQLTGQVKDFEQNQDTLRKYHEQVIDSAINVQNDFVKRNDLRLV